jgi:hypothetical protein
LSLVQQPPVLIVDGQIIAANAGHSKAFVGTLSTGYPRVQASSQDNGSRHPAEGSSEAATYLHGSGSRSKHGAAPGLPRIPPARAAPLSSGQLWGRHMSPRLGLPLPAQSSSEDGTCPLDSGSPSRLGATPGLPCVPRLCGL